MPRHTQSAPVQILNREAVNNNARQPDSTLTNEHEPPRVLTIQQLESRKKGVDVQNRLAQAPDMLMSRPYGATATPHLSERSMKKVHGMSRTT